MPHARSVLIWCAWAALLGTLAPAGAAENRLTAREKRQGWQLLFDGKTLDRWVVTGDPRGWVVEDGTIKCAAQGGGYLRSIEQYGDFVLSLEFKLTEGTNSGIFLRWADPRDPVGTGIEVQILDSYGRERPSRHDCGAIYDCLAPTKIACRPAGEWNTMVITCKGPRIQVVHNGERIIDMDLNQWTMAHRNPDGSENKFPTAYKDMARRGYLGLQDHGHILWFRNLKVRRLDRK